MERLSQIDPKTIIITPNRRLSAWLMDQFNQIKTKNTQETEIPKIFPYENWLTWHYEQATAAKTCHKLLITEYQSHLIWQSIVETSPLADTLLHPGQTAKLMGNAFKLSQQWLLPLDHPSFQDSIDYQTFQLLAKQYIETLKAKNYLDNSQLTQELEQTIINNTPALLFFGFAELTAEQQQLIQSLKANHKNVIIDSLHYIDQPKIERLSFKDLNEELSKLAYFCKQTLEQNPNQTIGCVIPNLDKFQHKIIRIFTQILPEKFNLFSPKPLAVYPIIYTALRCLLLNKFEIDKDILSHLLKTPFISFSDTELSARMQAEAFITEHNISTISLKILQILTEKTPLLMQLINSFEKISTKKPLSLWAETFTQQLQALGWPGERTLDSVEFQTVKRFHDLLKEFSALELVQSDCDFNQAYTLLNQLCYQTVFQSETKTQSIQILGSLEAAGLYFDSLWIAGLNSTDWPALHTPNPFLPLKLQREKSLPHANANHTLRFYQNLSQQLFHASPRVIVSHAEHVEGLDYQISQLIQEFPESNTHIPEIKTTQAPLPCEEYPAAGLALTNFKIKGGTGHFKAQAICPFQAYALFRLNARTIPETYFGLDAIDRGILVHKALELIWKNLKSSQQLKAKEETELRKLIASCIYQAIAAFHLSEPLKKLEISRLNRLLYDWLMLEKTREDFTVVETEEEREAVINDLSFKIRVDRIDETSSGQRVVIDYKTKKVTMNDCLGKNLAEPQLPIYALMDEAVTDIAFAQIRRDELKFVTLNDVDWPAQKQIWQEQLNNLATEIKSGAAIVNPKNASCCQFCDLHSLCRIHEGISENE